MYYNLTELISHFAKLFVVINNPVSTTFLNFRYLIFTTFCLSDSVTLSKIYVFACNIAIRSARTAVLNKSVIDHRLALLLPPGKVL